ncbi:hypothetical protein Tco_0361213 [Tanacetum coccineum]
MYRMIRITMIPNPDGTNTQILKPLSKMTSADKSQYIADVKVMNYLLQAIPNDIYNSVDACKNAKEMWEQIKRLMFCSDVTSHARHSRLMDEFNKFVAKEGESLESVNEGDNSRNQAFNAGNGNDDNNQIVQRALRTESTPEKGKMFQCYTLQYEKAIMPLIVRNQEFMMQSISENKCS